jgi:hypothetical protein
MRRFGLAMAGLFLLCAGCAAQATTQDSRWLLITSPATSDYPWGWSHMPLAQWEALVIYPTEARCEESLRNAQNVTQSPVACVAAHDLHRGKQIAVSPALPPSMETASAPVVSTLALTH